MSGPPRFEEGDPETQVPDDNIRRDSLSKLSKAKIFTTLDEKDGFHQIGLDEECSKTSTFWTPFGRYKFLRTPFGISVAPEEFQCKLHEKLTEIEGVEILRDDLLVVGY